MENEIEKMRGLLEKLNEKHTFSPGDVVRWKLGLKNRRFPEYDAPALVACALAEPVLDPTNAAGSPYFREPLDLIICRMDADEDMVFLYCDSRRFEPVV